MAEHYEWCIKRLSGLWLTVLGADDGLLPWGFHVARRMVELAPAAEALMFRRAYYFWPGVEAQYGDSRISLSIEGSWRNVDGAQAVQRVLRGRGEHFDLPQIYTNNFVKRDVVERVGARSQGKIICERNPDVYSGVAVAHLARTIVRCEVPAFWTGTSPSSMGLKQRQAVVDADKDSAKSVKVDFAEKSDRSGHPVALEVGHDLWLAAQSSPIYVLSAYLQFLRAIGEDSTVSSRRAVRNAFTATLKRSRSWRPERNDALGNRKKYVASLIAKQAPLCGLRPLHLHLMSHVPRRRKNNHRVPGLVSRLLNRSASAVMVYPPHRAKLRVTTGQGVRRLTDASRLVQKHASELFPRGTMLHHSTDRRPWPF